MSKPISKLHYFYKLNYNTYNNTNSIDQSISQSSNKFNKVNHQLGHKNNYNIHGKKDKIEHNIKQFTTQVNNTQHTQFKAKFHDKGQINRNQTLDQNLNKRITNVGQSVQVLLGKYTDSSKSRMNIRMNPNLAHQQTIIKNCNNITTNNSSKWRNMFNLSNDTSSGPKLSDTPKVLNQVHLAVESRCITEDNRLFNLLEERLFLHKTGTLPLIRKQVHLNMSLSSSGTSKYMGEKYDPSNYEITVNKHNPCVLLQEFGSKVK